LEINLFFKLQMPQNPATEAPWFDFSILAAAGLPPWPQSAEPHLDLG
jgi:hypothetical protein